ncbi:MAG TPA: hypothetical protein VGR51_05880 [Thermoplasmata archaeon]|jgi:tetratricopeptide (TPR) repeat protein|nr:hypothetical protein [Thermoplasmata archaeon]
MAVHRLVDVAFRGGLGGVYADEAFRRLERDARDADALFALAAILGSQGLRPEAIQVLTFLAEVDPRYPGLWRFKARLFREVGDELMAARCMQNSTNFAD